MLDLVRLRTFREVAGRASFSRAAEALDYTQSAVSQQISALERELGLTLIERGGRPVRLTEAGRTLLDRTDAIFGEVATAEAEMQALAGLESGTLRLGGFASACATVLPQAITLFATRHADVEVGLSEMEPAAAVRMLRGGDIDIAVIYAFDGDEVASDGGMDVVPLAYDPFLVALPEGHRLAGRKALGLADLKGERWLGSPAGAESGGYREFVLRTCQAAGFEPQIAFEPGDLWTGRGIVASGLAVGLMPQLAFTIPHPGVTLMRIKGSSPARHIFALGVRDRRVAAVPPMLDCLTEAFASHLPAVRGRSPAAG
jgi:DNA-binding transcriptional LysR family regulator